MFDKTYFKKLVLLILILALLLAGCEYPNPAQQPLAPTMSLPTETEVPLELELPTAIVEIPTMTSSPAVETFSRPRIPLLQSLPNLLTCAAPPVL